MSKKSARQKYQLAPLLIILFLLVFIVGLVIFYPALTDRISQNAKAGSSTFCNIYIDPKNQTPLSMIYQSPNFDAVQRGNEIAFYAICQGTNGLFKWNFGDNSCTSWEEKTADFQGGVSSSAKHTFTQNGDYWITVINSLNGVPVQTKLKIGVYNRTSLPRAFTQSVASPTNRSLVELTTADFNLASDSRMAGYWESYCTFSGTRGIGSTWDAFRELKPSSQFRYFDDFAARITEKGATWNNTDCTLVHNLKLQFWDYPGSPIRSQAVKLTYILQGNNGPGSQANLNLNGISVVNRKLSEYKEYALCQAPKVILPTSEPTIPRPTTVPPTSSVIGPSIAQGSCASRTNCPQKLCYTVTACSNQKCIYVPNTFVCGGGKRCDGRGNCVLP